MYMHVTYIMGPQGLDRPLWFWLHLYPSDPLEQTGANWEYLLCLIFQVDFKESAVLTLDSSEAMDSRS